MARDVLSPSRIRAYLHNKEKGKNVLVLTRRVGESIIVDGSIIVTITAIEENKVRLRVTAPPDIRIDREEIHRSRHLFSDLDDRAVGYHTPGLVNQEKP